MNGTIMYRHSFIILTVFLLFTLSIFSSCTSKSYDFTFVFQNDGDSDIKDLVIKINQDKHLKMNFISKKSISIFHGPFNFKPNNNFLISWTGDKDNNYKSEIRITDELNQSFSGYLYIIINNSKDIQCLAKNNHNEKSLFNKSSTILKSE
jgi:hypothetical protein